MTALAGCVGLGLLGLLQFQRSMTPQSTAKTEKKASLDGFKPLEDLGRPAANFSGGELPEGNTEPPPLSTRSRRATTLEDDLAFDDLQIGRASCRERVSIDV